MGTYAQQIALSKRLIAAKGEAATLRILPAATPTSQAWKPTATPPVDHTGVFMAFFPMSGRPSKRYADGSESKAGDKYVLIAADGLPEPPKLGCHLVRPSIPETWTVKAISPLDVGGEPIVYELWAVQ